MGGPRYGYGMGGYQPQMGIGSMPTQPADPSAFNTAYGVSQPPQNRPLPTAPIPPIQQGGSDVQRPNGGFVPPAQGPTGGALPSPVPMGVSMGGGDPYMGGQQQQMDMQQQQFGYLQPRPYGTGFQSGLLRPFSY